MTRLTLVFAIGVVLAAPVPPSAQVSPASIVLLLDVTASVSEAMASFVWDGRGRLDDMFPSGTKPPDSPHDLFFRPIARGFLPALSDGDRVRIGRITRTVDLAPGFSSNRTDLRDVADGLLDVDNDVRYGPTPLWDGLDMAVTALATEPGPRIVLLVTDGLSTGNRLSLAAVTRHAVEANVRVLVVLEAWRLRSGSGWLLRDSTTASWKLMRAPGRPIDAHLRGIADVTGGALLTDGADGWPDLERALAEAAGLMHAEP